MPRPRLVACRPPASTPRQSHIKAMAEEIRHIELRDTAETASTGAIVDKARAFARKFTFEQLLATLLEHGNSTLALAAQIKVDAGYTKLRRRELGVPSTHRDKGWRKAPKLEVTWPIGDVRWGAANVQKLGDTAMQSPAVAA